MANSAIKGVCVFCGSRLPANRAIADDATAIGRGIASRGWHLVYGSGSRGLMGKTADGALEAGGKVTGVTLPFLPKWEGLKKENAREICVQNMAERKAKMDELCDAYVILPGSIGTLDELAEIWTARYFKFHHKPIVVLNKDGYFDTFFAFCEKQMEEEMLDRPTFEILTICTSVEEVFAVLDRHAEKAA